MTGSSLQDALDEILAGDWHDARQVAIKRLDGGFAMSSVVCTRCAPHSPMTFVGAVRHLMQVESDRAEANPDLAYSQLHQPGDIRPGAQGELAPEPWSWSPCNNGCGMPVIWARTGRGKSMSVDREPDPNGTVVLVSMDSDGLTEPYAHFLRYEGERMTVNRDRLHSPHLNTCPKKLHNNQSEGEHE